MPPKAAMRMPSISFKVRFFRSRPWDASCKAIRMPCIRWLETSISGTASQYKL